VLNSNLHVRPALRTAALCTVLFAGTVLLFSRGTEYGFSNYDDPRYVTSNLHVQAGLTWDSVVWAFTAAADYVHPLTWLSHMLDWQVFGPMAYGHHLSSVIWHAVNAVLVFVILRRLTGAYWASAFSAALFAWHPLRVESVVWVTERKDVMSGFFFLVTIAAYSGFARRRDAHRPAWRFYWLALALFVGGLLSKPMMVTVPAVLLVLDFWPLRRVPFDRFAWRRWRDLLLEKAPFCALSVITAVATVKLQQHSGAFVLDLPLGARLGNAAVSVVRYLGKFFWPVDLAVCYPHPGYWPWWTVAGALLLIIGLTALAWSRRSDRPWILAGWIGFLTMLLPAIGIIQVGFQAMADRYTYLPILGLQIAIVWTMVAWIGRAVPRWFFGVAGITWLLACGMRTWDQQATWRDPVTMFQHAIAVTERNEIAHALLGYTLWTIDRIDEAERHAERALEINPRNDTALFTLASVREHQGRFDEARTAYRAVLQVKPADSHSSYRLGLLLLRSGQTAEAKELIAQAIRGDPQIRDSILAFALSLARRDQPLNALVYYEAAIAAQAADADAHYGAGLALEKLNRTQEAREHFETAIALRPEYAEAHTELGLIFLNSGEMQSAVRHFRLAVQTAPHFVIAQVGLGRAAEKLGETDEATASFAEALRLAPNNPMPHRVWADTLARRQQFVEAARHYERAAELDPTNTETRVALGFVLIHLGRRENGIAQWEEALRLDPGFPGLRERLQRLR
jgi:tetratricopeptide (TPR) repeat protein